MPDSDKTFGGHMHKKTADDTMIADGNPVGIFPKVVDNGLCVIKGFLTVRNPVLLKTDIQ